jgi:hypothetical protein
MTDRPWGTPPEHAFAGALDVLCGVLAVSRWSR